MARRFYCNCCGADWSIDDIISADTQIECPDCGALYDEDDETVIESYNSEVN